MHTPLGVCAWRVVTADHRMVTTDHHITKDGVAQHDWMVMRGDGRCWMVLGDTSIGWSTRLPAMDGHALDGVLVDGGVQQHDQHNLFGAAFR